MGIKKAKIISWTTRNNAVLSKRLNILTFCCACDGSQVPSRTVHSVLTSLWAASPPQEGPECWLQTKRKEVTYHQCTQREHRVDKIS